MGRINNYADLALSEKRPTFIGRPVEAIRETNQILDQRYKANKAANESSVDFLNNLQVESQNQQYVENAQSQLTDSFKTVIQNNDFEHADMLVTESARNLKNDKHLKGAIMSYGQRSAYMTDIDERVKKGTIDVQTAQRLKSHNVLLNSAPINVNEDGSINNIFQGTIVSDDPLINKQAMELASKLKADKKPITFPNGQTLTSTPDGQYKMSGTTESIDEGRAITTIASMLASEPKNQAWLAQQKMLDDSDTIVRNPDGTYVKDENGNVKHDYTQVDYKQKLGQLGINDKMLNDYLAGMNKSNPQFNINPANLTQAERQQLFRNLYDRQYSQRKIVNAATNATNLVDYTKVDLDYKEDAMFMAQWKLTLDKAEKAKVLANLPHSQAEMHVGSKVVNNAGDLLLATTNANAQLKSAEEQIQLAYKQGGGTGKLVQQRDANGVIQFGTFQPNAQGVKHFVKVSEDKDSMGRINEIMLTTFREAQAEQLAISNLYNSVFEKMEPTDLKNMHNEALNELTEQLVGRGENVSKTILAKTIRNKGVSTSDIGLSVVPGYMDYDSYSITDQSKFLKFVQDNPELSKEYAPMLARTISNLPRVSRERFEQSMQSAKSNQSIVADLVHVDPKSFPDIYNAAVEQIAYNYETATDLEGNNIAEKYSELTSTMIKEGIANGNLKINYTASGGTDRYVIRGTTKLKNENNDVVSTDISFVMPVQNNMPVGQVLLNDAESLHASISRSTSLQVNESAAPYSNKIHNFGPPNDPWFSANVQHVPIDANGNILAEKDQLQAKSWKFILKTAGAINGSGNGAIIPFDNIYQVNDFIYTSVLQEQNKRKVITDAQYQSSNRYNRHQLNTKLRR